MIVTPTQTVHLGVGIDTARYGHHVSFLSENRELADPAMTVTESGAGYQAFAKRLETLHAKYPNIQFHVRIDAAGQYATNLERYLRSLNLPLNISVGQPKQNKDYHQAIFPKRKADATESLAMARFAIVERPVATNGVSAEIYLLREIASRLEAQVKDSTQAINRLHNLLARVFPELSTIVADLASGWVLKLLATYPTPERIAHARRASLFKISHLTSQKAERIQAAAKASVGSLRGELAESLVKQLVLEVQQSQQAEKKLEGLLLQAFRALPRSGHVQLETIPGIGVTTAAVLVAKIVSIDRFASPDKLIGYFGVFPEERSSGVDRYGRPVARAMHMSRKGNDLVRRYLFCAARCAIRHNPTVRALYARLRARGTRGDVALGHAMRKLLQLVFAVWTTDKPFDGSRCQREGVQEEPKADEPAVAASAQKQAAGLKRDSIPDRKEVTAAKCKVAAGDAPVNDQRATDNEPMPRGMLDYARLRGQITIEQVLKQMGHFHRLSGDVQLRGPCPFHETESETSRSFSVNLKKNVFRCLNPKCNVHGNALDLWAQYQELPLYQAALNLADSLRLQVKPAQRRGNP